MEIQSLSSSLICQSENLKEETFGSGGRQRNGERAERAVGSLQL